MSKKPKITPLKGFKEAVMSRSAAPKLAKGVWPPGPRQRGAGQKAGRCLSGDRHEEGRGQPDPSQGRERQENGEEALRAPRR